MQPKPGGRLVSRDQQFEDVTVHLPMSLCGAPGWFGLGEGAQRAPEGGSSGAL